MFFRKKYPLAYEMAKSVSPMLYREFEAWCKKEESAFLNLLSFFEFLRSNPKLFKKCNKVDLSYNFLGSFKELTPEIKKIIDDLSEELCLCGKINRGIDYYIEELNTINGC